MRKVGGSAQSTGGVTPKDGERPPERGAATDANDDLASLIADVGESEVTSGYHADSNRQAGSHDF